MSGSFVFSSYIYIYGHYSIGYPLGVTVVKWHSFIWRFHVRISAKSRKYWDFQLLFNGVDPSSRVRNLIASTAAVTSASSAAKHPVTTNSSACSI